MGTEFEQKMLNLVPTQFPQTRAGIQKLVGAGVGSYDDLVDVITNRDDPELLSIACEILGFGASVWPAEKSALALGKALNNPALSVRFQAATAIGKIRSRTPLANLIKVATYQDEEHPVRIAAIQSLEHISDETGAMALLQTAIDQTQNEDIRILSLEVVGHLQYHDSVPAIIELLNSASARIRYYAVFVLGLLGDERATPDLRKIVNNDEDNLVDGKSIKQAALEALANIENRSYR
jgi:HEAT repeat protein